MQTENNTLLSITFVWAYGCATSLQQHAGVVVVPEKSLYKYVVLVVPSYVDEQWHDGIEDDKLTLAPPIEAFITGGVGAVLPVTEFEGTPIHE